MEINQLRDFKFRRWGGENTNGSDVSNFLPFDLISKFYNSPKRVK
jgi:hypothetical protein